VNESLCLRFRLGASATGLYLPFPDEASVLETDHLRRTTDNRLSTLIHLGDEHDPDPQLSANNRVIKTHGLKSGEMGSGVGPSFDG